LKRVRNRSKSWVSERFEVAGAQRPDCKGTEKHSTIARKTGTQETRLQAEWCAVAAMQLVALASADVFFTPR
jgi:hypothetical protein